MLSGETIIYFGPEPWDGLWRNRHQLMSRFAAQNDVWYVEPPTKLRRLFSGRSRVKSRLCSTDASGVRIFHSPWWLPLTGRAPFKNMSLRIYLAILAAVARTGKDRRPIVWLSRPNMVDYVGRLQEKLAIYHVVDEYSGYGNPTEESVARLRKIEDKMLRAADAVIVVTPTLFDLKSPSNPNTYLVPNAVDYDSYADETLQVPDDIADIQGPIIGYSGLVAARLDMELLRGAALARPKWNFVFVGAVNDADCELALQSLGEMDNVHFLGNKDVNDVPQYVRRFNVCVIPYVVNLRAQHASPLKLYEYAAASRPIVTTDFAAARAFEGHVKIAGSSEEFIAACEQSLAPDSAATEIEENRLFAAANTWQHRVRQISDILGSLDS